MNVRSVVMIIAMVQFGCASTADQAALDPIAARTESPAPMASQTPRFKEQFSGKGENENGHPFSFLTYVGPNGEKVSVKFEFYESANEAERRFEELVRSASTLIDETPLTNSDGTPAGKSAHFEVSDQTKTKRWKLTVVRGATLYIVDADSIEVIKDFESHFRPTILSI